MNEQLKNGAGKAGRLLFFVLLKNPIVLIVLLFFLLIFAVFIVMGSMMGTGPNFSDDLLETSYADCNVGDMDTSTFMDTINEAGVFEGEGDTFMEAANENSIDPVLLASIALMETGYGESKLVRERNNPGGLYNSSAGDFFTYETLDDGIDAMAENLYDNYISEGLVSIPRIGQKYAPVGEGNDPNNLNAHWVPNVSQIANQLGGLTMNCSSNGTGEMMFPINSYQTSQFGIRVHPRTGEVKMHDGLDFGCTSGQPIKAAMGGEVALSTFNYGGYGNYVVLDHGDMYTLYAHFSEEPLVDTGESVSQGQTVGLCGTSGSSTGTHLHFEVQHSLMGQKVDPVPYLEGEAD